ncbi:hypothetical protein HYZ41_01495 [archaeon]|nr:hypothetical protein [archaeon]
MAKKNPERKYIMDNFEKDPLGGELKNKPLSDKCGPGGEWLGHVLVASPFEARVNLDFTGPVGSTTGVYYSLMFQLGKWEFLVQKADEWIEVSPVHAQYYQLTQKQKEDLEGKIKQGLVSVSQAVADYELLLHDKRKYTEMLRYLGYRTPTELGDKDIKAHSHQPEEISDLCTMVDNDKKTKDERTKRSDNHSLKAVFVDQVDIHTGEGISIRSIVSRWPTLISDFMRLDDSDMEPGAVMKKLDISRAEAVVLVTKNKLFMEWKNLFLPELLSRYIRILELANSRKKSVDEYREWVKPYVARHKLIEEGLSSPERRASSRTSFMTPVGHALSFASIEAWVWKDFLTPEIYKVAGDSFARNPVDAYDSWTKKNLIFSNNFGLIVKHPWITDEWVKDKKVEVYRDGWLNPNRHYYSFFVIKFMRTNMRSATGDELEDGQFDVNLVVMSQNAMFVKLLELKAKQEEFNKYVDSILGIPHYIKGLRPSTKENNPFGHVKSFFDTFSIPLKFSKKGPYERDWDERITKYYLAPIAGDRYVPIVNFIKQKIGYGK